MTVIVYLDVDVLMFLLSYIIQYVLVHYADWLLTVIYTYFRICTAVMLHALVLCALVF